MSSQINISLYIKVCVEVGLVDFVGARGLALHGGLLMEAVKDNCRSRLSGHQEAGRGIGAGR